MSEFQTVEKAEAWVPSVIGDFVLGIIEAIDRKDGGSKSEFLLIRSKEPVLDAETKAPVLGPVLKRDGTPALDSEGKALVGPQYTPKLFRVTDAETVREFKKRLQSTGKASYNVQNAPLFISLVVTGFRGPNEWPDHELGFADAPAALANAAAAKGGRYFQHHPRVRANAPAGSAAPVGGGTGGKFVDDIPF